MVSSRRELLTSMFALIVLALVSFESVSKVSAQDKQSRPTLLPDKKLFEDDLTRANELVGETNAELNAVQKIEIASEKTIKDFKRALDARDVSRVKQTVSELIKMIDDGLVHGRMAAEKVEQASQLNVDEVFKEYLSLKAQSFRKQFEAYEARKKSAEIFRDAYGSGDDEKIERAKGEFTQYTESYKKLMDEAKELSDAADKIQRDNPDKIKSSVGEDTKQNIVQPSGKTSSSVKTKSKSKRKVRKQ